LASVVAVSRRAAETSSTDASRWRRRALGVVAAAALPVVLGGCQLPTFYGYRGSTKQGHDEFLLWVGTTIAAIVVGVLVAALIVWSIVAYRKKSDEIPRQFQYHIPLEITYIIVPVIMVLILFGFTVFTENQVDAVSPTPAVKIHVTAFQWGWRYQYPGNVTVTGVTTEDPDPIGYPGAQCAPSVDCLGPGLVIPAGQTTRITLNSQDVIHGFYVPQFNFSRYAQPGITNVFDLTPFAAGVYRAQCTQLCGLYHSLMFFHVVALPPHQFQAWLKSQQSLARADATVTSSTSSSKAAA
jgi:cytochrome c oxidase subunit II